MKCTGTPREWDHCQVEKRGCPGCYYCEKEAKDNKSGNKHMNTNTKID